MGEWFLGEIRMFSFGFAPESWLACDGQILPINNANSALFSALGTRYGGDGKTNFALPDLRGRIAVDVNPGTFSRQGMKVGVENVALSVAELPLHNHNVMASSLNATTVPVKGNYFASPVSQPNSATPNMPQNLYTRNWELANLVTLDPGSIVTAGGGYSHNNIQPYLAMQFCIATTGYFPPHS